MFWNIVIAALIASVIGALVGNGLFLLKERRRKARLTDDMHKRQNEVHECLVAALRFHWKYELKIFVDFVVSNIEEQKEKEALEKLINSRLEQYLDERLKDAHVEVIRSHDLRNDAAVNY